MPAHYWDLHTAYKTHHTATPQFHQLLWKLPFLVASVHFPYPPKIANDNILSPDFPKAVSPVLRLGVPYRIYKIQKNYK